MPTFVGPEAATVLVYEPDSSGHKLHYLSLVVTAFRRLGIQVVLGTTSGALELFARHHAALRQELVGTVAVEYRHSVGIGRAKLRNPFNLIGHYYACLRKARAERRIDHAFICFLDGLWPYLTMFGNQGIGVSGVLMRADFWPSEAGEPRRGRSGRLVKRQLAQAFSRAPSTRSVYLIDEIAARQVAQHWGAVSKMRFLRDPASYRPVSMDQARARLGLPRDGSLILSYGLQTDRKNAEDLLHLLSMGSSFAVVLAGRQDDAVRAQVLAWRPRLDASRLFVQDRYLSEEEEDLFFSACNAVWVNYRGHAHMSGVMVKGALAEKLLIGCDQGLIGWYLRTFGMGLVAPARITPDFVVDVEGTLADPEVIALYARAAHEQFKLHSAEGFVAELMAGERPHVT